MKRLAVWLQRPCRPHILQAFPQRFRSRASGGERGQSLVELALALPLLLSIVFAAVEFGGAYKAYVGVTNAAREGAMYAMTNSDDSTYIQYNAKCAYDGQSTQSASCTDSNITVTLNTTCPCSTGADYSLTVSTKYTLFTPLAAIVKLLSTTKAIPSSWTISSTVHTRVQ